FIIESKQDGHQSNARVAASCVLPGDVGHVYSGSHGTKATSPEQRHSSSAGVQHSGRLRSVCWEVFLLCAYSEWHDRCENTGWTRIYIRVEVENCAFFVLI